MSERFDWIIIWLNENVFEVIRQSHDIYWNNHIFFFVIYIISLILLVESKKPAINGKKLYVSFSLIAMLGFCYNPIVCFLFTKLPQTGEAVYSRIWIFLPVWMVIACAATEMIDRIKSKIIRNGCFFLVIAGIVLTGVSLNTQAYYIDTGTGFKANSEGIEIADEVLSSNGGESVGLLLFDNAQAKADNFYYGGTKCYAIEQYTSKINVIPIYYNENIWSIFSSDGSFDGESVTDDAFMDMLIKYRSYYDFSYVVMPQEMAIREKMESAGYKYITSVNNNDIYTAMPQWFVQSLTGYMEDNKKIYVLSDNIGHFVVVGGGDVSDRRQLQRVLYTCGNHVDAWILPSPSAENIAGLNYILTTKGFTIDKVFMPAIDFETIPDGFMNELDLLAYDKLISLADEGVFELGILSEGDEFDLYGMDFSILSDMTDVQVGSLAQNSMLFQMKAGNKSVLFCSYIGYEQGQLALQKYESELDSDYVQIASGSGDGLGQLFYETVSPDVALCDSVIDDAARQTYDLLVSVGIECYCLENNDPTLVVIK